MKCIICNKEFETNDKRRKCCSPECSIKNKKSYVNIYNNKYFYNKRKLKALKIVGKGIIKCTNCGCDDIRILEINHINGGGYKEYKEKRKYHGSRSSFLVNEIVMGRRKIDDLNILCHVCNHAYYIKLKYGIDYNIKLK